MKTDCITRQSITCPNCGKTHDLTDAKQKGWMLLDELQAIVTTVVPLLLGLCTVFILKILANHTSFTPSIAVMCISFIVTAVCTFPLMLWSMIRYQKGQLQSYGITLYRVSCDCRPENAFFIVRHIATEESKSDPCAANEMTENSH